MILHDNKLGENEVANWDGGPAMLIDDMRVIVRFPCISGFTGYALRR